MVLVEKYWLKYIFKCDAHNEKSAGVGVDADEHALLANIVQKQPHNTIHEWQIFSAIMGSDFKLVAFRWSLYSLRVTFLSNWIIMFEVKAQLEGKHIMIIQHV